MSVNEKFFDDLNKMAQGAMGAATSVKDEASSTIKEQVEALAKNFGMASREDLEQLQTKIEALEARLDALEKPAAKKTAAKAAPKPKSEG